MRQDLNTDPHNNLYDVDMTDHIVFTQEYFHAVSNVKTLELLSNFKVTRYGCNRSVAGHLEEEGTLEKCYSWSCSGCALKE